MTIDEFLKTVYHTRNNIVLPHLGRARIDKSQFIVKGKYSVQKEQDYLREIFQLNKSRLKE